MSILPARLVLAAACIAGLTAACSAPGPAGGTLHGHLYGIGGPAPGLPRRWPGTVTVTGSGIHREVTVGPGGTYSVTLPAGSYAVVGHSPLYGAGLCRTPGVAKVRSGHSATANVLCQMR